MPAARDAGAPASAKAIGICASTGGPKVLTEILGELPADFPLPVLVVQHIAVGFVDDFAQLLDKRVPMSVAVAQDGAVARPGVWLAPDDAHLMLDKGMRMRLDRDTVVSRHRPSADVLLESLATAVGPGAVAVVLTGMGRDGGGGIAAVKAAGGLALAQDEPTSAIYSMPAAAVEAGARAFPPNEIVALLRRLPRR